MFKLPASPSPQADPHELADFAELLSWDRGTASKREIVAALGRVDDNENNIGCDDDEDKNSDLLDEVLNEIERRSQACGSGYPFSLELNATVLRHDSASTGHRSLLYRYLLLSTRLDMKSDRKHGGIDGADLLEDISAQVLQDYLGGARACSLVFGTATRGRFQDKINNLCRALGEGGGFESLDTGSVDANDDKLDAVAWVPFSDRLPGQLILFGQCKTGSNWEGLATQLQPETFVKKWMRGTIVVNPLRAFCVAEAADRSRWQGTCATAGLFLDRCRLVDFCSSLPTPLLTKVTKWTTAAKKTVTFSGA